MRQLELACRLAEAFAAGVDLSRAVERQSDELAELQRRGRVTKRPQAQALFERREGDSYRRAAVPNSRFQRRTDSASNDE